MKIKDKVKPKIPPVAPGAYVGVCVGVVDLGEQHSEKFKNYSRQVQIIWELDGQTVEVDGKQEPRQLSRTFTFSVSKKSNLRAFLCAWNGIQYNDDQIGDLDLFDQIGKACMLNVVLNETGEYANINSIMQLPAGYPAPQTVTPPMKWDMDQWDDAVFATLPEWIQEKIKKSTQYQKAHPPTNTIDFAANASAVPANASAVPANASAQIPASVAPVVATPPVMPANTAPPVTGSPAPVTSAPAAPAAVNPPPFDVNNSMNDYFNLFDLNDEEDPFQ